MAKKRATKAAVKVTGGEKRQIPAMYPTPAPVELTTPQKIVAIDLKTKTITIEGSPPPELVAAAEMEQRRLNLPERLKQHARICLNRISPHWGERPKHISPATWRNLERRVKAMAELQENAPAEARDALMALHTLNRLVQELVEAGDWPETIDRAICYAIDFGQLLQRGQSQIDHGETVDLGKRNAKATAVATEAKHTKKNDRSEPAHDEYTRRMATVKTTRMKLATLNNMSEMKDDSGNQIWKIGTLRRWAKNW